MKRDIGVTVTRTSRVTRTCDIARRSRVSHATTTTPHHTRLLLRRSVVSGYDQIQVAVCSGDWTWNG